MATATTGPGGSRRTLGPQTARALAGALPNAILREYEDSGHFPYVEEPERFERDVTEFLTRLRGAAPCEKPGLFVRRTTRP